MVNLNFTLIVQLGLFLVFLWVLNRLVLRPMLRAMDHRDEMTRSNEASALADTQKAQSLESTYLAELSAARRKAATLIERSRRSAMRQRMDAVAEEHTRADKEIAAVRGQAMNQMKAQRPACDELAPGLADEIARHLRLKGE